MSSSIKKKLWIAMILVVLCNTFTGCVKKISEHNLDDVIEMNSKLIDQENSRDDIELMMGPPHFGTNSTYQYSLKEKYIIKFVFSGNILTEFSVSRNPVPEL